MAKRANKTASCIKSATHIQLSLNALQLERELNRIIKMAGKSNLFKDWKENDPRPT
jgi:hypothetical protein